MEKHLKEQKNASSLKILFPVLYKTWYLSYLLRMIFLLNLKLHPTMTTPPYQKIWICNFKRCLLKKWKAFWKGAFSCQTWECTFKYSVYPFISLIQILVSVVANKTIRSPCIRDNYKCTRTCHSSDEKGKCHEVRLLCSFGGCRKKTGPRS